MLQSVMTFLARVARRLIVRAALYALLAVLAVVASVAIGPLVPQGWIAYLGTSALETVLTTLASSLLAVTIFSLTILASTFRAVESSATPRAVLILREDHTTHRILSVFIGGFLFALTSIILLATPLVTPASRFVLFAVTLVMVVQVVVAIIRWIHHIETLGTLENLLDCLQAKSRPVLAAHWDSPSLQANPMSQGTLEAGGPQAAGVDVHAAQDGYVTMIALDALQDEAEACEGCIHIHVRPGDYVTRGEGLMRIETTEPLGEVSQRVLRSAIVVQSARSFDQDPEFCVIVMTEIANRALSSGINDPQTAVDVVHRLSALLLCGISEDPNRKERIEHGETPAPRYDRIWIRPLDSARLIHASFDVIARESDVPELRVALCTAADRLAARGPAALLRSVADLRARLSDGAKLAPDQGG